MTPKGKHRVGDSVAKCTASIVDGKLKYTLTVGIIFDTSISINSGELLYHVKFADEIPWSICNEIGVRNLKDNLTYWKT